MKLWIDYATGFQWISLHQIQFTVKDKCFSQENYTRFTNLLPKCYINRQQVSGRRMFSLLAISFLKQEIYFVIIDTHSCAFEYYMSLKNEFILCLQKKKKNLSIQWFSIVREKRHKIYVLFPIKPHTCNIKKH